MAETKTYEGGCHCGKVRYRATTDLGTVIECNCSICSKKGALLTFVPASAFEATAGDDSLTAYHFNKHVIDHLFCPVCGVSAYARGTDPEGNRMVALNVRCLDGVDVASISTTKFDGRSR